jgi:hypothetical protein
MAGLASSIASFTLLETLAPMDEIFSWVVLGSDIKAFWFNRVDEAFTLEVASKIVCGLAHRFDTCGMPSHIFFNLHAIKLMQPRQNFYAGINDFRLIRFMMTG